MILADKITLALFALLALALLLGSGTPPAAYADITPAQHWGAYVSILWFLGHALLHAVLAVPARVRPARRRSGAASLGTLMYQPSLGETAFSSAAAVGLGTYLRWRKQTYGHLLPTPHFLAWYVGYLFAWALACARHRQKRCSGAR